VSCNRLSTRKQKFRSPGTSMEIWDMQQTDEASSMRARARAGAVFLVSVDRTLVGGSSKSIRTFRGPIKLGNGENDRASGRDQLIAWREAQAGYRAVELDPFARRRIRNCGASPAAAGRARPSAADAGGNKRPETGPPHPIWRRKRGAGRKACRFLSWTLFNRLFPAA